MSRIKMKIDDREVTAKEGQSVLEVAREAGIEIPTLCHDERLEPFGGCRLCMVEVQTGGWAQLVVSCVYEAKEGLVVRTRSEEIDKIRRVLLELLMAHAPTSPQLLAMGEVYGARPDRFEPDPSFCVHCGLCVRYCNEVKQLDAIGFIDRGVNKEISFVPEIAAAACEGCKECFPLCPTSYLQAAFVRVEALSRKLPRA
ncbi:MAG: 2Fe-2S iron-sulfur cluster-binding protein [Deltaproteobacteria bacterium]|nr:2Fe-2S iron-sulfur cluster-binding protein [Deltaproteobacteria bacterium]